MSFSQGNQLLTEGFKNNGIIYPYIVNLKFLFDDDPLVSKYCRKRLAKKGDITRILKPKMVDGILVAQRDIVLKQELSDIK